MGVPDMDGMINDQAVVVVADLGLVSKLDWSTESSFGDRSSVGSM